MKKEKKVVKVIQAPIKIVSVVFTIPTSFSYESVKVELTGIADNGELVSRYNELVDIFRPKPKLTPITPVKEPMKSYTVARTVPPSDDEAGGAVIREDKKDEKTIALQKEDIVALLEKNHKFVSKGKTKKEISDKVFDCTGLLLEETNFSDIIDALKK